MEHWYSLLDDPGYYEALKERVEIEFAADPAAADFGADEPVALEVDVKNVETLLVKVFEINTFNYYREPRVARSTPRSTSTAWSRTRSGA